MKKSSSHGCGCGVPSKVVDTGRDPVLQNALEAVSKHEDRILEALETPENEARFLVDPCGLLASLGIAVPSALSHRLRRTADARLLSIAPPAEVRLPNGQRIAPHVRVRFTRKEAGG